MSDSEKYAEDIQEFRAILDPSKFKVVETMEHHDPHPYCITDKHVVYASDKFGGRLGGAAIKDLEDQRGPSCGMYVDPAGKYTNGRRPGYTRCTLGYEEHKLLKILVVQAAKDLGNKEAGEEIFKIKELLMKKGYEGVAFKPSEFSIEGMPA